MTNREGHPCKHGPGASKRSAVQHNRGRLAITAPWPDGAMVGLRLYGHRSSIETTGQGRDGLLPAGAGLPGKWRCGGQIRRRLGRWVERSILLLTAQYHSAAMRHTCCAASMRTATWVVEFLCGAVHHRRPRAWFCCHLGRGQLLLEPSR
jgi:hypothetical protein